MQEAFRAAAERSLAAQGEQPVPAETVLAPVQDSRKPPSRSEQDATPWKKRRKHEEQPARRPGLDELPADRHRNAASNADNGSELGRGLRPGRHQPGVPNRPVPGMASITRTAQAVRQVGGKNASPKSLEPAKQPARADIWRRFEGRLAGVASSFEARAQEDVRKRRAPSQQQKRDLAKRLALGDLSKLGAKSKREVEVILGIDFGTTSTKIVVRWPYEAGALAVAVPALPYARAEEHAYLWASRLWLGPNGNFSLFPDDRASLICAIKTNLMAAGIEREPLLAAGGDVAATAEEIATAFLALQIRQAKGWLATEKAGLLEIGRPVLSYNLGFPAASLNQSGLRASYEACAVAAVELADTSGEVTLEGVRSALVSARNDTVGLLERLKIRLHPEIAAAVAGFANSMQREDGLYAMVDVGGGTVDCCTFNLFSEGDGVARCPIFLASVERLGVETWQICKGMDDAEADFRYLLDTLQTKVIWQTKLERYKSSDRWTSGLPLFLVGGGALSEPHVASTGGLDLWLQKNTAAEAGVRIEALPAPENLDHSECTKAQVQRLGVAIGLSLPATDIPEPMLPAEIEDDEPLPMNPIDRRYVDKDQV
jgi:hypothetical protein